MLEDVEPDEVLIAIPSAPATMRARVVSACRERGVPVRTMPTVFELLQGGGQLLRQVREVRVEDVLGREPVRMEIERVGGYLTGRVVLVTGAGGSIGSELCRQIARVGPSRLVLLDHAEDNLFEIERELVEDRHALNVGRGARRLQGGGAHARGVRRAPARDRLPRGRVQARRPDGGEPGRGGAQQRARHAADGAGGGRVRHARFVLVSTDKAVAPATVMGASKALAEWAVEAAEARFPDTAFCAVRFGNVLGSSGSVVPIFRRQIAAGGPVTVTDPEMTRYFMTIPEAVQLVIRAGLAGAGRRGVRARDGRAGPIMDLARDMIRLSGLEPERDIAIEIIGRRPGEKLHEELFNPYERPQPTPAQKILRAEHPPLDPAWERRPSTRSNWLVARRRRGRAGRPRWASWPPGGRRPALDPSTAPVPRNPGGRDGRLESRSAPWSLLAFSLQDQVEKYGAYVGIAAFFGLAVLSLLYFAQARELKRLREWAGARPSARRSSSSA